MRAWPAILLLLFTGGELRAQYRALATLHSVNRNLSGRVVDFTKNHKVDRRLYSEILCQHRDLYVYTPPGFCSQEQYPLILWLHGVFADEHASLDLALLEELDRRIACGEFPPVVVALPDGVISGRNLVTAPHSFFINGVQGRFQDHLMLEVVPFVMQNFSIRPETSAHAVIGVSGGGFGAMNLALKYPQFFGHAATIAGAVNIRYCTREGDSHADFDPASYHPSLAYRPRTLVLDAGLVKVRARHFVEPVFGNGPGVVSRIIGENPADLLFTESPRPGAPSLFLAWGNCDELNMDAQGASFAWLARGQGLPVTTWNDPQGSHSMEFFRAAQEKVYDWLELQLRKS